MLLDSRSLAPKVTRSGASASTHACSKHLSDTLPTLRELAKRVFFLKWLNSAFSISSCAR